MGSVPDEPAADRPREWLALPGGRIRPVVSVPGPGGIAELLAYGAWLARLPVRQASPGFGPDLRKRGVRSPAPGGSRHLTRRHTAWVPLIGPPGKGSPEFGFRSPEHPAVLPREPECRDLLAFASAAVRCSRRSRPGRCTS